MPTLHWRPALLGLLIGLLMASGVLAMSSTHYALDWFVPLTGGGGPVGSTSYRVNYTLGQTVAGSAASAGAGLELGYWRGAQHPQQLYLPSLLKA